MSFSLDLTPRLEGRRALEAAAAGAPVRYVTQAFIDALQGSWGELTPVEPVREPELQQLAQ